MHPIFEAVPWDADGSFRYLHFHCAHLADDHGWHYHPEYELTWVVRSEGTRFVGDHIAPYHSGDLVLLGPNLPHCWHDEPRSPSCQEPELVVLQFDANCFGAGFLALPEAAAIAALLRQANVGLQFPGTTVARLGERLLEIERLRGMDRLLGLLQILNILAQCRERTPLATADYSLSSGINPVNRRRVEFVHSFVRKHLGGDISQAEIANELKLSAPAFSRFFKAATGKTFVAFVNTLRVSAACRLLQNSELPVTEIAMTCGYNNVSNFNRQFLALQGVNPTQYRSYVRGQWQRQLRHLHAGSAEGAVANTARSRG